MNKQSYFKDIKPNILREMNYLRLIRINNDPNSYFTKKRNSITKKRKRKIEYTNLVKLSKQY